MIESAADLVESYAEAFQKLTGQETCPALDWARDALNQGTTSVEEMLGRAAVKMHEGTADAGWLLGPLRLLWSDLSERQRLLIMSLLRSSGALKTLLNRSRFPAPFTEKEKAFLATQFERTRAVSALRRLNNG